MIKPSEFTPRTSELMERMFRSAYDETEVAVFTGGPEVGGAFTTLAFDHLLFTGATSIAYHADEGRGRKTSYPRRSNWAANRPSSSGGNRTDH